MVRGTLGTSGLDAGISPQAGGTPQHSLPPNFGGTQGTGNPPSPSSSLLQHGDGAKARRPDSGFLPKLGINWVKVSAARLARELRLLPELGPAEGL